MVIRGLLHLSTRNWFGLSRAEKKNHVHAITEKNVSCGVDTKAQYIFRFYYTDKAISGSGSSRFRVDKFRDSLTLSNNYTCLTKSTYQILRDQWRREVPYAVI